MLVILKLEMKNSGINHTDIYVNSEDFLHGIQ